MADIEVSVINPDFSTKQYMHVPDDCPVRDVVDAMAAMLKMPRFTVLSNRYRLCCLDNNGNFIPLDDKCCLAENGVKDGSVLKLVCDLSKSECDLNFIHLTVEAPAHGIRDHMLIPDFYTVQYVVDLAVAEFKLPLSFGNNAPIGYRIGLMDVDGIFRQLFPSWTLRENQVYQNAFLQIIASSGMIDLMVIDRSGSRSYRMPILSEFQVGSILNRIMCGDSYKALLRLSNKESRPIQLEKTFEENGIVDGCALEIATTDSRMP